jgi:cell division septation protein DedD
MSRTDNEQEFVLGNKQLLSAFFVVVLLLGVFFAMGYVVGSNAGTSAKKVAAVEPPPTTSSSLPVETTQSAPPPPLQQETAASHELPPVESEKPTQVEAAPPPRVAERPVEKPAERPVERNVATKVESVPGHTYLQVSAVKRAAADSIVRTLKDKGFPALLGESSKPNLFRVLLGPYPNTESLSKAKSELKAMGFDAVVSK